MIYDVRSVDFTYPGTQRQVLHKISFTVEAGEIMEILGPNGAGKTTLLSLMLGFMKADGGEIRIKDRPIDALSHKEIAKTVGYVPQAHEPSFDYKVKDFIIMGAAPDKGMFQNTNAQDEERCFDVMKDLGIEHLADRSYVKISGGERQQVLIARAIMARPEIILFDEPTAHLDYGNAYRTLQMVKHMAERGFAVVMTTHDPNHALLLGGKTGIIDRTGHMYCGPAEEILTEEHLAGIYNCPLRLIDIEEMQRRACITPNL